jgi:uncharacterized LabA/DUF88 family protein
VSKNVAVFVDVANLYYSARGQEVDVDYVALLKAATKGRDLIRAYAYSGLDPENENQRKFIDFLGKNGYKVVHKDIRKFGDGRVKANLDIELVVDLFRLAKRMDIAVIVSGDGDFAPAIRALQDEGVRCEVISFRPNTSSDLIAVADEFIDIMKIASIGRGAGAKEAKADKGMSAPPMPAKEVVPEFGFREASPSVAAAALAAAREGRDSRSGTRGRAGSGRSRSKAPAEEPAVATVSNGNGSAEAATAAGEDGRRRRRRRGGRGRGRGRNEGVAASPETVGEIGWVELDDISQIDELESEPLTDDSGQEREYTFEEADEATLAELGLLDGDAGTAVADQAAAEKPARRSSSRGRKSTTSDTEAGATEEAPATARRSRSRKTAATAEAPADPPAEAAEKPARRTRATKSGTTKSGTTSRKSKAASTSTDEAAAEGGDAAAKPKRRRSPKSTSAATDSSASEASSADADGDGQPQGIWQRFRSARGGTAS